MDYKSKYLKYKAKYINLKNQLGGACPESNPDDPSEKINPTNSKELLRAYLKAVERPNDGEFSAVKQGTKKAEDHSSWNAALAWYENQCTFLLVFMPVYVCVYHTYMYICMNVCVYVHVQGT